MGSVADVTDADFDQTIQTSDVPVLVDFWGPNCAPCKAIAPHLETLATETDGRLRVVKMNIHANMWCHMWVRNEPPSSGITQPTRPPQKPSGSDSEYRARPVKICAHPSPMTKTVSVSYTHLRAHET